jgi:nucleoside-diphosphate-sugar epimerase
MTGTSPAATLVTGASGFVGGHLARRLLEEGRPVRLLVRDAARLAAPLRRGCEIVVGNLGQPEQLRHAVRGVGSVFHCAANVSTWDRWPAYHEANVAGVAHLLRAIAAERPPLGRFVHFSSVDVYDFPLQPCDEDGVAGHCAFGYGESKRLGELQVREICAAQDIPYTVLRPANIFGPGSPFVARIGDALRSGLMLSIDGGRANAGLLDIDNLIDRALWAAGAEAAAGRCYNVRDRCDVSWAEILRRLGQGIGGRGRVVDLSFRTADRLAGIGEAFYRRFRPAAEPPLHRLLVRIFGRTCGHSAERLRRDCGLAERVDVDAAMEQSIRWYREARSPH